jgi:tetratricopeptide (TPR) repeat protein
VLIILAGAIAYGGSLGYPFIFDDEEVIPENPHILQLWPLTYSMSAPPQSAVSGRPIVCLSLAVNYRLGGLDPRGYRIFNVLVHVLAAFTLFGVIRRTLVGERLSDRFGRIATPMAAITALMWLLHPLQTESVTYVVQRSESMMGLFYLLTLYCAIRSWDSQSPRGWQVAAVVVSALGMATKEVMVTAPLMVLLYDAFFRSGSIRRALWCRAALYVGLAASWGVLAAVMLTGPRSGTVGFSHGVTALQYAANQCIAVVSYIRLALWPHPLILDYGFPRDLPFHDWAPYAAVLAGVLAATGVALVKRPRLGFSGLWFFLILAPTSSFVPITTEVAADRRMYLPLAGICVLVVIAGQWLWSRVCHAMGLRFAARSLIAFVPAAAVLAMLGILTVHRNSDYRSPLAMWGDNVGHRPGNARARNNLGKCLYTDGRREEAVGQWEEALRLKPDYYMAHDNLAIALLDRGDIAGALEHNDKAMEFQPGWAAIYRNRAYIFVTSGKLEEAAAWYRRAVEVDPLYAEAHYDLGTVMSKLGQIDAAIEQYKLAIQARPNYADAHNDLGALLAGRGEYAGAIGHYAEAVRLNPAWAEAYYNMGLALAAVGRFDEAAASYRRAIEINPRYPEAQFNLANTLLRLRRTEEAVEHYTAAIKERPDYLEAHGNLGGALKMLGRSDEGAAEIDRALQIAFRQGEELRSKGRIDEAAEVHYKAVQIRPDSDEAHYLLGRDLLDLGRVSEAAKAFRRAMQINPDNAAAKSGLEAALKSPSGQPPDQTH